MSVIFITSSYLKWHTAVWWWRAIVSSKSKNDMRLKTLDRGSHMSAIERRIQLAMDKVSLWANSIGFRFSNSKTVIMHFCRMRGVHLADHQSVCDILGYFQH